MQKSSLGVAFSKDLQRGNLSELVTRMSGMVTATSVVGQSKQASKALPEREKPCSRSQPYCLVLDGR